MESTLSKIITDFCNKYNIEKSQYQPIIEKLNSEFYFRLKDMKHLTIEKWNNLKLPDNLFNILEEKYKECLENKNENNNDDTEEENNEFKNLNIINEYSFSIGVGLSKLKNVIKRIEENPINLNELEKNLNSLEIQINNNEKAKIIFKIFEDIINNIITHPNDEKYKNININKILQIYPYNEIENIFNTIQFIKVPDSNFIKYSLDIKYLSEPYSFIINKKNNVGNPNFNNINQDNNNIENLNPTINNQKVTFLTPQTNQINNSNNNQEERKIPLIKRKYTTERVGDDNGIPSYTVQIEETKVFESNTSNNQNVNYNNQINNNLQNQNNNMINQNNMSNNNLNQNNNDNVRFNSQNKFQNEPIINRNNSKQNLNNSLENENNNQLKNIYDNQIENNMNNDKKEDNMNNYNDQIEINMNNNNQEDNMNNNNQEDNMNNNNQIENNMNNNNQIENNMNNNNQIENNMKNNNQMQNNQNYNNQMQNNMNYNNQMQNNINYNNQMQNSMNYNNQMQNNKNNIYNNNQIQNRMNNYNNQIQNNIYYNNEMQNNRYNNNQIKNNINYYNNQIQNNMGYNNQMQNNMIHSQNQYNFNQQKTQRTDYQFNDQNNQDRMLSNSVRLNQINFNNLQNRNMNLVQSQIINPNFNNNINQNYGFQNQQINKNQNYQQTNIYNNEEFEMKPIPELLIDETQRRNKIILDKKINHSPKCFFLTSLKNIQNLFKKYSSPHQYKENNSSYHDFIRNVIFNQTNDLNRKESNKLSELIDSPIITQGDCFFIFPDKYVIKGIFCLYEKVSDMYDYIKNYLNNKRENFSLYLNNNQIDLMNEDILDMNFNFPVAFKVVFPKKYSGLNENELNQLGVSLV